MISSDLHSLAADPEVRRQLAAMRAPVKKRRARRSPRLSPQLVKMSEPRHERGWDAWTTAERAHIRELMRPYAVVCSHPEMAK